MLEKQISLNYVLCKASKFFNTENWHLILTLYMDYLGALFLEDNLCQVSLLNLEHTNLYIPEKHFSALFLTCWLTEFILFCRMKAFLINILLWSNALQGLCVCVHVCICVCV